jgi:outer membrane protein OmpA-like peptidoglycan-associated protein
MPPLFLQAQDTVPRPDFFNPELFTISIREDYSVRVDGRYSGYLSREIYGSFQNSGYEYPSRYEGYYYGTGAMRHDQSYKAHPLEINYFTGFIIDDRGYMQVEKGGPPPLRMNIPRFPEENLTSWKAPGRDALLYGGEIVPVETSVAYNIEREEMYEDRPAIIMSYRYPLRLKDYQVRSLGRDGLFRELFGNVDGTLILFLDDEGGMFMKERIIRRIVATEGAQRDEEGFRLIWYTGVKRESLVALVERIARIDGSVNGSSSESDRVASAVSAGNDSNEGDEGDEDDEDDKEAGAGSEGRREFGGIVVEARPGGVVLTLPDIHFEPDSAVILPDERDRLDELARALSTIRDKTFLVVGHTADVGSRESQKTLSVERAIRIVNEMVERGLDESRFLYDGVGGTRPVASNDTEEGRAQNRRVEVLLLD